MFFVPCCYSLSNRVFNLIFICESCHLLLVSKMPFICSVFSLNCLMYNAKLSGLENREYDRGDPLRCPRDTLYPQNLALTSPKSGGRSVGIVCLLVHGVCFVCIMQNSVRGLSKSEELNKCNLYLRAANFIMP
jgi:hypothetical protein